MAKRWYVVQTKSLQEQFAADNLKDQGFVVFYPAFHNGEKKLPLFPGYIFTQFDVKRNKRWQKILSTRGVYDLLGCTADYLPAVTRGYVEKLMERLDDNGCIPLEPAPRSVMEFTPGMLLRVTGLPHKNMVATYCKHTEKTVTVKLCLLNRELYAILPIHAVHV